MKKISVVVPCYNAADCLHHCMDHLVGQTIGIDNIEIILVDDASTGNGATWQAIMQYENQYPESVIAISLEKNLRQGGARNVGISYASGEYLVFCDSDDWLRVEALELLYGIIKHENADVVEFCSEYAYTYKENNLPIGGGDNSYEMVIDDVKRRQWILFASDEVNFGCWNKIYRMSLIQEHNIRFAEHMICEEPSFGLAVRMYTVKYVFINSVLYYYYQNPKGTIRSSWAVHKMDNANVWVWLFEDLKARGFVEKFPLELEYMFWSWGIELTIEMAIMKKLLMEIPELSFLKNMAMKYCPDIRSNPLLGYYPLERTEILIDIMNMELTTDNVYDLNRRMIQYIRQNSNET